ncbi:MAG: AbrB/MazE/SpoVT family DNA-binding domain-containing protein [Pigmentiphaga sp.]|nr:AbrB/MazE/SpoVT family DNA-binding domain-containing protein [Pigmentiphaga sp.]
MKSKATTTAGDLRVAATVQMWGNSLALRIPKALAKRAQVELGTQVELIAQGDELVLRAIAPRALSLEEKLARFDPAVHGGESLAVEPVGQELF